jgi:phosphoglycolate phosphatase-like HAD superfamily hydrolase
MSKKAKLILVDHDGTLCKTSATAYDSIHYCVEHAIHKLRVSVDSENLIKNIEQAFRDTAGTTEKNLLKRVGYILALPPSKLEKFQEYAYQGRAKWYKSMKAHDEFIFDTYYHDTEQLLSDRKDNGDICMLVTVILGSCKER